MEDGGVAVTEAGEDVKVRPLEDCLGGRGVHAGQDGVVEAVDVVDGPVGVGQGSALVVGEFGLGGGGEGCGSGGVHGRGGEGAAVVVLR
jgi:hypothetical protein